MAQYGEYLVHYTIGDVVDNITFEYYQELKARKLKRAEIAEVLGIPDWKLKKLIAANGWGKQIPTVFEQCFSEVDEYSAYWAGFIAADGNVDSKHRVRLMLKHSDLQHLYKFREFCGSTHTIQENTTKYDRCAIEFTSAKVAKDLEGLFSIVPNKTTTLQAPRVNLGGNLRDFIRGYFDGDGSICESFSNQNSNTASLYATFCSGSKDFTAYLVEVLRCLGCTFSVQTFDTKQQIKLNTLQAIKFLDWMYKDAAVYLDRKYSLYENTVVNGNRITR